MVTKSPASGRATKKELVEAAGQRFHVFRHGLDYTFILLGQDAGRVIHRAEYSI
jgi:hypothetical protein